jgi:hypothetical protein
VALQAYFLHCFLKGRCIGAIGDRVGHRATFAVTVSAGLEAGFLFRPRLLGPGLGDVLPILAQNAVVTILASEGITDGVSMMIPPQRAQFSFELEVLHCKLLGHQLVPGIEPGLLFLMATQAALGEGFLKRWIVVETRIMTILAGHVRLFGKILMMAGDALHLTEVAVTLVIPKHVPNLGYVKP